MTYYAWMYSDYDTDVLYWSYSWDISATDFARVVSDKINRRVKASDVSCYSDKDKFEKHLKGYTCRQLK